jgi:hypothetical protein
MDYERLERFVAQHGKVSIVDTQGRVRILPSGDPDIFELIAKADQFLWDGLWRSRAEIEALIAQSERGLKPGCAECERLEKELIRARDIDRAQKNLEPKYELPALSAFKEHRIAHQ